MSSGPDRCESDPDQARLTLACHGLADLVAEVAIIDGKLAVRFTRSATLEQMESVADALRVLPEPTRCE